MANIWFRVDSVGSADGTSEDNAYGEGSLATQINNASAGDNLFIIAEKGKTYSASTITITNAGTAGSPIRIIGVSEPGLYDGAAGGNQHYLKPVFDGGRDFPWNSTKANGGEGFRLGTGAGHIHFINLAFRNCNQGVSLKENVNNFFFGDCDFINCGNAFFSDSSNDCQGLTFEGCNFHKCAKEAIRLTSTTSDVLIKRCRMDMEWQEDGNICQTINIKGSVSNVTIDQCWIGNSVNFLNGSNSPQSSYIQGDGLVCEPGTSNVTVKNSTFYNHTDGGVDMKGSGHLLEDCRFEGGTRNVRIWASNTTLRRIYGFSSHELESTNTGAMIQFNGGTGCVVYESEFYAGKRGTSRCIHLTTGSTEVEFELCKFTYDTDICTLAEGSAGDEYTLTNCLDNSTFTASGGQTFS